MSCLIVVFFPISSLVCGPVWSIPGLIKKVQNVYSSFIHSNNCWRYRNVVLRCAMINSPVHLSVVDRLTCSRFFLHGFLLFHSETMHRVPLCVILNFNIPGICLKTLQCLYFITAGFFPCRVWTQTPTLALGTAGASWAAVVFSPLPAGVPVMQ